MKKSKLQAYIDFITQLHHLRTEKKTEKKSGRFSASKKLKVVILLVLSITSLAGASILSGEQEGRQPSQKNKKTASASKHFVSPVNSIQRIELLSFTAILNDKIVDIQWTIQKDIQNAYFTIERSQDDNYYYSIGNIESTDNYDGEKNYFFIDEYPLDGISYYRLVQTDNSGLVKRFPSTVVYNKNKFISIFPNPAPSGIIQVSGIKEKSDCSISVRDMTGKIVPSTIRINESDIAELTIDNSIASRKGIFIVTIQDGNRMVQKKLVIR